CTIEITYVFRPGHKRMGMPTDDQVDMAGTCGQELVRYLTARVPVSQVREADHQAAVIVVFQSGRNIVRHGNGVQVNGSTVIVGVDHAIKLDAEAEYADPQALLPE